MKIIKSLVPFLFVTAASLLAFAHLQFICDSNSTNISEIYVSNLIAVLSATFEFKDEITYDAAFVIKIMFTFLIGILLLNILIAVISNDFTAAMENSKRIVLKNRLNFLLELKSIGLKTSALAQRGKSKNARFSFDEEENDTEIDILMRMTARYQSQIDELQKGMREEMKQYRTDIDELQTLLPPR